MGSAKGGVIRALNRQPGSPNSTFNRLQSEIRIDQVDHSLAAFIGVARMSGADSEE